MFGEVGQKDLGLLNLSVFGVVVVFKEELYSVFTF